MERERIAQYARLAGLELGKRTPDYTISDPGYFWFGNHKFRDDKEGGHGMVDMYRSIVHSCDTYYYTLANEMGVDLMAQHLAPFGFGQLTGIDLEGEVRGVLPSTEWKRRAYRKPEQQRWYAGETISLGIGQGYNNFTMLQIATAVSTLSTGGQRFKPRLVREIEDVTTGERRPMAHAALPPLPLKPEHVELITRALYGVTQEGTSVRSYLGAPYKTGGKTGTAQAVSIRANEKYNAAKLEEHQRDHSLYIAFAPAEPMRTISKSRKSAIRNNTRGGRFALAVIRMGADGSRRGAIATVSVRYTSPTAGSATAASVMVPSGPPTRCQSATCTAQSGRRGVENSRVPSTGSMIHTRSDCSRARSSGASSESTASSGRSARSRRNSSALARPSPMSPRSHG